MAFPEEFGYEPGIFSPGLLVSSLRELGFDLVFDTNTGADLTICEEGHELLQRILVREQREKNPKEYMELDEPLPLLTSCES